MRCPNCGGVMMEVYDKYYSKVVGFECLECGYAEKVKGELCLGDNFPAGNTLSQLDFEYKKIEMLKKHKKMVEDLNKNGSTVITKNDITDEIIDLELYNLEIEKSRKKRKRNGQMQTQS